MNSSTGGTSGGNSRTSGQNSQSSGGNSQTNNERALEEALAK